MCSSSLDQARILAASAPHSGDWLHAIPFSNCGQLLENEEIRIAVGLRIGAALCSAWFVGMGVNPSSGASQPSLQVFIDPPKIVKTVKNTLLNPFWFYHKSSTVSLSSSWIYLWWHGWYIRPSLLCVQEEHRRKARAIVSISTPSDCAPEKKCSVHDELIPEGTNIRLALRQRGFYLLCDLISFYYHSLMVLSFFIHPAGWSRGWTKIEKIIVIWFGDTVTVSHLAKCDTNSKVRALSWVR